MLSQLYTAAQMASTDAFTSALLLLCKCAICGILSDSADIWLQVGASNELPESEELDALYDRFLIRRQVSQVSDFGLPAMLAAAADNSLAVFPAPLGLCKL